MKFGKTIEALRATFGITQEELGNKIGVSRQTIFKWEKEKAVPKIANIMIICETFDLDLNSFIEGKIVIKKD